MGISILSPAVQAALAPVPFALAAFDGGRFKRDTHPKHRREKNAFSYRVPVASEDERFRVPQRRRSREFLQLGNVDHPRE